MVLRRIFENDENTRTAKIYLSFFFRNVGRVLDKLMKKLEGMTLCIPGVYEVRTEI